MEYSEFLATTALFEGSTPDQIDAMLDCLEARIKHYQTGDYIFRMGDTIEMIGLVLKGRVRMESVDVWGNASVATTDGPGQLFGEVHAAIPNEPLMFNVVASEECTVLFLNLKKVLAPCSHTCPNHCRVSMNMATIFARRNLELSQRIFHAAPRSIRGKVLAYLSSESKRTGSREFTIPFDRQQLADYLGVDRSALSSELGRMQKAGLIETQRSHFILKNI